MADKTPETFKTWWMQWRSENPKADVGQAVTAVSDFYKNFKTIRAPGPCGKPEEIDDTLVEI